MDPEVWAALITAGASLVIAIFSLVSSRIARSLSLRAEEQGKRIELLRLKGIKIGDKMIAELSGLIVSIEGLAFVRNQGKTDIESNKGHLAEINIRLSNLYKMTFETAIYTTPEIRSKTCQITKELLGKDLQIDSLIDNVVNFKNILDSLALSFRRTYLKIDPMSD